MMYLPELNHISNNLYDLSGFGGINRRATVEIGEFTHAVNLSSDEYPLIMPRKRYDVGLFPKTILMWHNNDRDMALAPALSADSVEVVGSQDELVAYFEKAQVGTYGIVWASEYTGVFSYVTGDEDETGVPPLFTYELKPGNAYWIKKDGYNDSRGVVKGSVEAVTDISYIYYSGNSIQLPTVVAFKNPVCANIGTSTVICDEINGMWVLEYDKDTDSYTYSKVHNKYTVANETSGSLITGGNYCHVRCRFEDNTLVAGFVSAKDEAELEEQKTKTDSEGKLARVNYLIAYGANPYAECSWYRLTPSGNLEPVDFLHYEFCTLEGAMKFLPGDYVEIKMSGIWNRTPDMYEELSKLDGMFEVVAIRENESGVKYSLVLKNYVASFATMNALLLTLGSVQKEGEAKFNNLFLAEGMTIERKAPENVNFICSHMNRIWCNNGNNEIMCCARGNPFVWYRYEGNALDSWATTIGGDGAFTGCINYGYPLFFKDNRMFRITGTRPANFGFDEYSMRGIKAGCHNSAVIVNDVLYYQSIDGIYAYASSTPVCVSDKVYRGTWHNGRACRFRDKYYIAVQDNGENRLYCYDTRSGIWHSEDMNGADVRYLYPGRYLDGYEEYMTVYTDYTEKEKAVKTLVSHTGNISDLSSLADFTEKEKAEQCYAGYVMTTDDSYVYTPENSVYWEFETSDLLVSEPEYKYLKAVYVNCRMVYEDTEDSVSDNGIDIYVKYDDKTVWESLMRMGSYNGESRATWYKHVMSPHRCENLKLRFEGVGKEIIYRILLEFEKGSTNR